MSLNQEQPEVSLVIPARNEAGRLPATLDACQRAAANWPFSTEIVVFVEPGSDNTAEVAEAVQDVRVLRGERPRGKGFAVRSGMLAARGSVAHFFMDADLSVPLKFVPIFVEEFQRDAGVDVLVGSRRHPKSHVVIPQPWQRVLSGRIFNGVVRVAGLTSMKDTQCGFKAFRASWTPKVFPHAQVDGFATDVEILMLAQRMGANVREMPVEWMEYGESSVRFSHGIKAIRDVLELKFKK